MPSPALCSIAAPDRPRVEAARATARCAIAFLARDERPLEEKLGRGTARLRGTLEGAGAP